MINKFIENKVTAAHHRDQFIIDPPATFGEYFVANLYPNWPCDPPFPRSARPSLADYTPNELDSSYEQNRLKNKAKIEAYNTEDRDLWTPVIEQRKIILLLVRSTGSESISRTVEDHRLLDQYQRYHESHSNLFNDSEIEEFWLDEIKADKYQLRRYVELVEKWQGNRKEMISYWANLAEKIQSHFDYGRDLPR